MPHLKLQKLLYYVEAWHLAIFQQSLIVDKFKAWMHGPVSTKVWHEFKDSKSTLMKDISIPAKEARRITAKLTKELKPDQLSLIDDVLSEYGPLTAYQLEGLTHSETPWVEARNGIAPAQASTATISKETMRKFYRGRLYGSHAAKQVS